MSQTVRIKNFSTINLRETTELSAAVAAAVTTIPVHFSEDLAISDYLYLGRYSGEGSELLIIATVPDINNVTVNSPGTKKPHSQYEPATVLYGNQVQLYRAANVDGTKPADASFAAVGSPVEIDFDQSETLITDATGGSDWWYKFTFRNAAGATETSLADCEGGRGGSVGRYCTNEEVRGRAGLASNRYITDADIDVWRLSAQDEINSTLIGLYTIPFTDPINPQIKTIAIDLAAGQLLLNHYGPTAVLNTTNGQSMIDSARALLKRIQLKELILPDVLGGSTAITDAGGLVMWPDSTTGTDLTDPHNGAERMFTTQDRY